MPKTLVMMAADVTERLYAIYVQYSPVHITIRSTIMYPSVKLYHYRICNYLCYICACSGAMH